ESLIKQLYLRCVKIDEKENKHELVKKLESKLIINAHTNNKVLVEEFMDKVNNKTQQ
ncbi:3226_t:CDS:2, partial [Dentiscutata heterogama]